MKDNKVEGFQHSAAMPRRQFLQGDARIFDQVLVEQEVAVIKGQGQVFHCHIAINDPPASLNL